MADNLTPAQRRRAMQAVRSRDTSPEKRLRTLLHRLGYRYRLHRKDLPGKPDLVFPSRRKVIFVHGCFWHGHRCARARRLPRTNTSYWVSKIERNAARDRKVRRQLRHIGWRSLVVWECQLRDMDRVQRRVVAFLETD